MTANSVVRAHIDATKIAGAVVSIALVTVCGLGLPLLTTGSLRAVIPYGIAIGVVILVCAASAFWPRLHAAIIFGFSAYFKLLVWLVALIGPMAAALYCARSILSGVSLWLQVALLIAWGLLLAGAIRIIVVPAKRNWLFDILSPLGVFAPIGYAINILAIAAAFFATISTLLAHGQLITLLPPPERAGLIGDSTILHGMLVDFFVWHFFSELPLHVNETLKWDEPMRYQGPGMGLILLLFKATVIGPVVAMFALWWKQRTGGEPGKGADKAALRPLDRRSLRRDRSRTGLWPVC